MKYCKKCVIPDTRPNIILDNDGVCNACNAHQTKSIIDWDYRENLFKNIAKNAKERSKRYDCLIPVSGGKDSTWQVITCLKYGLTPLTVTWKPPLRTDIGNKNLENLINIGVDHIDYQINPKVEKKFMYQTLDKYGSPAIPMHMAIFNIPLKIAILYDIPLIVWGENSAFEYGGTKDEQEGYKLDNDWYKKFGVTHGTTAKDWLSESLTEKELTPYFGHDEKELEKKKIIAVFLGYYFKWDPNDILAKAQKYGFQKRDQGPITGYYDYADIDDDFISVHHYLKWYKFGFTRLFDNLSIEIRNSRLSRENAIEIIKKNKNHIPIDDIAKLCNYLEITRDHFFDLIEKFRNKSIWKKKYNRWYIENFIIPDWSW